MKDTAPIVYGQDIKPIRFTTIKDIIELKDAGIEKMMDLPKGVEASIRQGKKKTLLFLINHTEEKKTVNVPPGKEELISNSKTGSELELDRYDVRIIKL